MKDVCCSACGERVSVDDRFCEGCGQELAFGQAAISDHATVCSACGQQFVDGYCGSCGLRQPAPRDHIEVARPGVGAVTDKGKVHHRNEDCMAVAGPDDRLVIVVSDGVSTTDRADEASQLAVDTAAAVLLSSDPPDFAGALTKASESVTALAYEPSPDLGPPSCTFLAAVVTDIIQLASLGDCRSYWVDSSGCQQLTQDDSWATEQLEAGRPHDEVYEAPQAHAITRWIGADADPSWRPTTTQFTPPGPGRLLLVSDGLWNYTLQPSILADAVAATAGGDALACARHLTEFANTAGGHDNITVVVVDMPRPNGSTE